LRVDDPAEVDLVVRRSLLTILEVVPELRRDENEARRVVPNFSPEAMLAMYTRDFGRPATHRFWVAVDSVGEVVGHVIFFRREPEGQLPFGYLFTLYVDPAHRRRSVADALIGVALGWFEEQGVASVRAHTHPSNAPLLHLMQRWGFVAGESRTARWPSVELEATVATRPGP